MELFWEIASKSDVVLSLISVIISLFIWAKLKRQEKKLQELASQTPRVREYDQLREVLKGIKTIRPVAVCMSLIPNKESIKESVKEYLKKENMDMEKVVEINRNGLSPDQLNGFMDEVRVKLRSELNDATEIHLFIQGPVMAAAIVGGMLTNWGPVKLYHFNIPHGYEYWGPLVKF